MKLPHLVAVVATASSAFAVQAADFPLTLQADNDSRWYDFLANEFAELGRGSIGAYPMYSITAESNPFNPTVYSPNGDSQNVFPNGSVFTDIGVVSYGGTGNGDHPITGLTLNVAPHVADNLGSYGTRYQTILTNVTGSVTVAGGQVTAIAASADIAFRYDTLGGITFHPTYNGDLIIDGDRLEIFVHERVTFTHGYLEHGWDIRATVQGLGNDDIIFSSDFESALQ